MGTKLFAKQKRRGSYFLQMYIEHSDNPCIQNTLIVYLVSHYHCQLFQEKRMNKKTNKFIFIIALEEGNF